MINPFVVPWLIIDAVAVIPLVRLFQSSATQRTPAFVMAAFQLGALGAVAMSAGLDVVAAAPWIWAAIFMVNLAVVIAGSRSGLRWLSVVGFVGTVAAAVLLAIGSFAWIAVAAAFAIVALGAALLPASAQRNPLRSS